MNLKRIWVLFVARNYEFIRDRAGFGWNILFPFLIVAGFGIMFTHDTGSVFRLGVFPAADSSLSHIEIPESLKTDRHIRIIGFKTEKQALKKLVHHEIDMVLEKSGSKFRYWISDSSPGGHIMENMLKSSILPDRLAEAMLEKMHVKVDQIRYIDWLFPGILGMNIMFSSLFGVGYVIVRYRRIGVLKRLKATPVTAFEYLAAQMVSRVLILFATSFIVWVGCDLFLSLKVHGAWFDVFVVFLAGTVCLVCLGLVIACRGTNEELTNGIINFICWPMMFLSQVWFSIEGSAWWVKKIAEVLPLTRFLSAARKIINDGATLADVSSDLMVLAVMSLVFLAIGAFFFSWTE